MYTIFHLSISSTPLIIIALFLRLLLKNKMHQKIIYNFWKVIAISLLIPIRIPSKINYINILQYVNPNINQTNIRFIPSVSTNLINFDTNFSHTTNRFTIIWILGFSFCTLYFLIPHLLFLKECKISLPINNDVINKWVDNNTLNRKAEIRQSEFINTPVTYGILNPTIIIPSNILLEDNIKLNYVLTHEFIHIKNNDVIFKYIFAICLCIHWYNPLVWIMHFISSQDIELSCDQSVIVKLGESIRHSYASILIDLAINNKNTFSLYNNFSKNFIEERVIRIMKSKKICINYLIIIVAFTILSFFIFGTSSFESLAAVTNSSSIDFSPYEYYGLTIGTDNKIYYHDKLIRCFDDVVPGENNSAKAIGYYEKSGITDIVVERDNNYKLIGLRELSSEEFKNKVIVTIKDTNNQIRTKNDDLTELFSVYKKFGLIVNNNSLYFDGIKVRLFLDIVESNNKEVESVEFTGEVISNWDISGSIDVYAMRDSNNSLIELKIVTDEEFAKNTSLFSSIDSIEEAIY